MYRSYIHNREILFPARLDENIEDDAPVRVINDIIDGLDIRSFDWLYSWKGRRAYHPKMMLKAVIFGYMNNRIFCSLGLEKIILKIDTKYFAVSILFCIFVLI